MKTWFLIIGTILFMACSHKGYKDVQTTKGNYNFTVSNDLKIDSNAVIISGSVFDQRTKKPIYYGIVTLKNHKVGSTTDSNGHFEIRTSPGNYIVEVQCVGNTILSTKNIKCEEKNRVTINFYLGSKIIRCR